MVTHGLEAELEVLDLALDCLVQRAGAHTAWRWTSATPASFAPCWPACRSDGATAISAVVRCPGGEGCRRPCRPLRPASLPERGPRLGLLVACCRLYGSVEVIAAARKPSCRQASAAHWRALDDLQVAHAAPCRPCAPRAFSLGVRPGRPGRVCLLQRQHGLPSTRAGSSDTVAAWRTLRRGRCGVRPKSASRGLQSGWTSRCWHRWPRLNIACGAAIRAPWGE